MCYLLLEFFDFFFLLLGTLLMQLVLLLNHGISDGVLGIDGRVNIVRRRRAGGSTLFAKVSIRLVAFLWLVPNTLWVMNLPHQQWEQDAPKMALGLDQSSAK